MILELLGKVVDAEALTDSDTYIGSALDLVAATTQLAGGMDLWIVGSTTVAASYADVDETYQFQLRTGTDTDGTDIDTGALTILETPAIAGNDARIASVGAFWWRSTLPVEAVGQRYLQFYYAQVGTTNLITVDINISPSKPRTNFNIQVEFSNVGTP